MREVTKPDCWQAAAALRLLGSGWEGSDHILPSSWTWFLQADAPLRLWLPGVAR
jgi:hypothetical protein